jgi:transposase-like protein
MIGADATTKDITMCKDNTQSKGEKTTPKSRRFLTPEKKLQIFLEAQQGDKPVGEILRREGLYSSDLVRIREQVKEGALERLAALKRELEEKERALADLSVELAVLRKKTNGGSWDR